MISQAHHAANAPRLTPAPGHEQIPKHHKRDAKVLVDHRPTFDMVLNCCVSAPTDLKMQPSEKRNLNHHPPEPPPNGSRACFQLPRVRLSSPDAENHKRPSWP